MQIELPFTLKPFQRVRLGNGNVYIVVEIPESHVNSNRSGLIGLRPQGWVSLTLPNDFGNLDWCIVEVYAPPQLVENFFDANRFGKTLWQYAKAETYEKLNQLLIKRCELDTQIATLEKEIEG